MLAGVCIFTNEVSLNTRYWTLIVLVLTINGNRKSFGSLAARDKPLWMDQDRAGGRGDWANEKKARVTPERTAFLVHRQSAAAPRVTASIIATRGAYTPVIATRMRRLVAACSLPGCRLPRHADRIGTSFIPPSTHTFSYGCHSMPFRRILLRSVCIDRLCCVEWDVLFNSWFMSSCDYRPYDLWPIGRNEIWIELTGENPIFFARLDCEFEKILKMMNIFIADRR